MALINCPECNSEISDQATSCPDCGYPIKKSEQNEKKENQPQTQKSGEEADKIGEENGSCLGAVLFWGGLAWIGFMIVIALQTFGTDPGVSDQQRGSQFIVTMVFIIPGVISAWMGGMLNK